MISPQELTDLQKSVPELTIDNDRLKQEKSFLMEKLNETEKRLTVQIAETDHLRVRFMDKYMEVKNRNPPPGPRSIRPCRSEL